MRSLLVAGLLLVAAEEMSTLRGPGFSIAYPAKSSKLQPPSASVPFQVEYRKNSLVRLEIERLTQPIDLSDESFAAIFLEVQLERLRERVSEPLVSQAPKRYPWGTGVEFVYLVPARSGKKNERDRVTEIVTTVDETLYRFTTWIPEKEVAKAGPAIAAIVASFQPQRTAASAASATASSPGNPRFSLPGLAQRIRERQQEIESTPEGPARSQAQAALAEALGLRAYLAGSPSPSEAEEITSAAGAALRADPGRIASQRARAWAAYHRDQMVEMEQAIQAALGIDPQDAESHLLHALWYAFNPVRSEEMARKAIEANPELAPAYYVKALADRRAGDSAEAREALERAVSLDPTFVRAREELAELLEESGDSKAAAIQYRELARSAPDDTGVRFRLAVAARKAGMIDEAIAAYQDAIRLDPQLAEAHYNLAVLYLREKDSPDLAARSFRRFLEIDPESERADAVQKWLKDNRY